MTNSYKGFFKDWEIAIAKSLVNEFQIKWELLRQEEFEDLLQESLIHWISVKNEYDSNQDTSKETFMYRIIKNKLSNIVERVYAYKRKLTYQKISLEDPVSDEEESPALIDTIPESYTSATFILHTYLKIDISKAIQKLTPRQKALCHLLGKEGLTIKEASENLKVSRDTIYEEIRRIKVMFGKDNLEEYLK